MSEEPSHKGGEQETTRHLTGQIFRRVVALSRELPTERNLVFEDPDNGMLLEWNEPTSEQQPSVPVLGVEWLTKEDDDGARSLVKAIMLEESGVAVFDTQMQIAVTVGAKRTIEGQEYYGDERTRLYKINADGRATNRFVSAYEELPWQNANAQDLIELLGALGDVEQVPDEFELA